MLYFYYGDNLYDLEEKLALFKERYFKKHPSGINFVKIDFEEDDLDVFQKSIESHSMFEETKLVFVAGVFSAPDSLWVDLTELIEDKKLSGEKDVVVLFYEKKAREGLAKKKKRFEYLLKNSAAQEFIAPKGGRLLVWIKTLAAKKTIAVGDEAIRELASRVGNDTVRLANELVKLALYKKGGRIEKADVSKLVTAEVTSDIFRTIDALARKDVALALKNLNDHWQAGDDPLQILGMFAYELRVLLTLKESLEKGGSSGLNPFVIQKNLAAAKSFSWEELLALHNALANADIAIKMGKKEPHEALEDFVLSVTARV